VSDVGAMRHRVTWQSPPTTLDAMNEATGDWVTRGTLACRVEPLCVRDLFNARQLKMTSTHKITLRGGPRVGPSDRFLFHGADGDLSRVFGLDSINRVDERSAYLVVMATEEVNPS
jgi:head-tail adaptor